MRSRWRSRTPGRERASAENGDRAQQKAREDAVRGMKGANVSLVLRAMVVAATVVGGLLLVTTAMADLTAAEEDLTRLFAEQPIIVDGKAGRPILRGRNLVPGQKVRGQLRIWNRGKVAGVLYVRPRGSLDTPGPYRGELSQKLVLKIRRVNRNGHLHTVWKGHLATMGKVRLAVLQPGKVRRYRFVVRFQVRPPARSNLSADHYQGSRFTTDFVWTLVPLR
jgi:hypothetical protein